MSPPAATPVRSWRLVLSLPPSVNNLFNSVIGQKGQALRIRTDAYNAWIETEGYRQRWERLSEDKANGIRWRCELVAYGLAEDADVDNLIKPAVDLICKMTGLRDCWPLRHVAADRADEDEVGGEPWIAVTVEVLGEEPGWRERLEARRLARRKAKRRQRGR